MNQNSHGNWINKWGLAIVVIAKNQALRRMGWKNERIVRSGDDNWRDRLNFPDQ